MRTIVAAALLAVTLARPAAAQPPADPVLAPFTARELLVNLTLLAISALT